MISNVETSTGKDKQENARKRKEVNRKAVEEWKEKRLMRMDEALTKIDEVIEETKMIADELPQLILNVSEIKHEETRKEAAKTLVYVWSTLDGKLKKIDALVNEGMTVPEDKDE